MAPLHEKLPASVALVSLLTHNKPPGPFNMRKLKVYLDTSIVSFLYADDAPDFQAVTMDFFKNYSQKYDLFISQVVLREIDKTPDSSHRDTLKRTVQQYPITTLAEDEADEVDDLAAAYLDAEVLPRSQIEDA
jgi:predicted nucleic-acid-binding protein